MRGGTTAVRTSEAGGRWAPSRPRGEGSSWGTRRPCAFRRVCSKDAPSPAAPCPIRERSRFHVPPHGPDRPPNACPGSRAHRRAGDRAPYPHEVRADPQPRAGRLTGGSSHSSQSSRELRRLAGFQPLSAVRGCANVWPNADAADNSIGLLSRAAEGLGPMKPGNLGLRPRCQVRKDVGASFKMRGTWTIPTPRWGFSSARRRASRGAPSPTPGHRAGLSDKF